MSKIKFFISLVTILSSLSLMASDTGNFGDGVLWDLTHVADNFEKAKCEANSASDKGYSYTHHYIRVTAKDSFGEELIATVFRIDREGLSKRELAYYKPMILQVLRDKGFCQ